MSIIQEAVLDPPCKINVAHSVLPLSALFFIAFVVPTSDKLSLCQLELEFKLPEGKGELPLLFPVFPQGSGPCVEYCRYIHQVLAEGMNKPPAGGRDSCYPPLIPRSQAEWERAVQTFVELSSSIAFDKWRHPAGTERSTCRIYIV